MGYTERPAFVQLFQIILILATIALQGYAMYVDYKWNYTIHPQNYRPCLELTKRIDRKAFTELTTSGLDKLKLTGSNTVPTPNLKKSTIKSDIALFKDQIIRNSVMEKASLILTGLSLILLVFHLGLACASSNYEYRTKWTAAVQGTVMFLLGFAGVLLPISAYDFDTEYSILSSKFRECRILRLCVNNPFKTKTAFHNFVKSNGFNAMKWTNQDSMYEALDKTFACQMMQMKIVAGSLCGVIVILSVIIIASAMELTTIYNEEDVDEEERVRRAAFHHVNINLFKRRVKGSVMTLASSQSISSSTFPTHGKKRMSLLPMSKRL